MTNEGRREGGHRPERDEHTAPESGRGVATEAGRSRRREPRSRTTSRPRAGEAAGRTQERARPVAEPGREAKGEAKEAAAEVREAAREVTGEAKEAVREAGEVVRARASEQVEERTHDAADRGDALARALRRAGESLHETDQDRMGHFAEQAARRVERFDGYLRRRDTKGLLRDLEELARENTALFLAGTFVAGLAAARFLRASSPEGGDGEVGS